MALSTLDTAHLVVSLTLLCAAAYGGSRLFAALRQPPVIGEILAGLLLGPTVFGWLFPGAQRWVFPAQGADAHALGALYQLGMLFLMFVTGAELRLARSSSAWRTVAAVTVVGLSVPMAAGLSAAWTLDPLRFSGPNGTRATFVLVFGMAIAVTSIPVISRIMLDLGILRTPFARVVLAVAVTEDVVLYVVLAVILGLARQSQGTAFGLWSLAHDSSPTLSGLYYTAASLLFFAVFLVGGTRAFRLVALTGPRADRRRHAATAGVALLLVGALLCSLLGINQVFGALAAGACVAGGGGDREESWTGLREMSLAFFIPLYFALVGLGLDLRHEFDPWFFAWFLPFACAVKAASVWAAARLTGQPRGEAVDLAVALNARGGPGILLATITLAAGVINQRFFTSLVLLSVVTSELAGAWLRRRRVDAPIPVEPAPVVEGAQPALTAQ